MGGQLQLEHLALNTAQIRINFQTLRVAGAAEDNVVEMLHGPFHGGRPIGGGVGNHVGPHGQIQLPAGKYLPQAVQALGVGQIDGDVVGKEVHAELIRHGHGHNLPPDQRGLRFFRPRKLVDGEIDLEAQIPDGLHNSLVRQGKGVESAGEKRRRGRGRKAEGPVVQLVGQNEAVNVGESGRSVKKRQLPLGNLVHEEENFFGHQDKQGFLILEVQGVRGKQPVSQNVKGGLADGLPAGGKAPQQQARQPVPPGGDGVFVLVEALLVYRVVFQHRADGSQRRRHHSRQGRGEQKFHLANQLVQLSRREPKRKTAQIFGDVFRAVRIPCFQGFGKLHGNFVPPCRRQHRGKA
ncbi:hypothetical protein SDC9_131618 [bioreactor metagenome]|uniref:Uncharacterized protein n=1 Tax=bioreactor metagenome TaxID=1076179 RepID=A0A645D5Q6_9ZZZZ